MAWLVDGSPLSKMFTLKPGMMSGRVFFSSSLARIRPVIDAWMSVSLLNIVGRVGNGSVLECVRGATGRVLRIIGGGPLVDGTL